MIFRGLAFAAASLLIPSPVAPANMTPMVVVSPDAIVQVMCFGKDWISAGTAFRVGPTGLAFSVNHVTTSTGQCFVAGKPLNIAYKSPDRDFSEILVEAGPYLQVDCGGFVKGRKYVAFGYARGLSDVVSVELTALGKTNQNESLLYGMIPVIPGMSGGPILDAETGKVVGTVNMEDFEDGLSWSVPLSDTPVCHKRTKDIA